MSCEKESGGGFWGKTGIGKLVLKLFVAVQRSDEGLKEDGDSRRRGRNNIEGWYFDFISYTGSGKNKENEKLAGKERSTQDWMGASGIERQEKGTS